MSLADVVVADEVRVEGIHAVRRFLAEVQGRELGDASEAKHHLIRLYLHLTFVQDPDARHARATCIPDEYAEVAIPRDRDAHV